MWKKIVPLRREINYFSSLYLPSPSPPECLTVALLLWQHTIVNTEFALFASPCPIVLVWPLSVSSAQLAPHYKFSSYCQRMSQFKILLTNCKKISKKSETKQTHTWHSSTARVMRYSSELTNQSAALTHLNLLWKCGSGLQWEKWEPGEVIVVCRAA